MRTYLVATENIVSGSVYNPGQIFLVAKNDKAQGGYHARPILHSDIENEPDFSIEYGDGTMNDPVPPMADDAEEFVFVPGFPVEEFTDVAAAVKFANEIAEEENYTV